MKKENHLAPMMRFKCFGCDTPYWAPVGTQAPLCSDCQRVIGRFIKKAKKIRGHYPRKTSARG